MSDKPKTTLAICRPIYEYTEPQTERSLRFMEIPRDWGLHMFDVVGQEIEKARNMLTEQALKVPGVTHLLWIDGDMQFGPDALKRLYAHDVDVVGGLCFSRHVPYHPVIGRIQPEWLERDSPFGWVYYYPPDQLFEVDATGAALLLVKADVFRRMADKFGAGEWWTRMHGESEDFSFMRRCRQMDTKVHVDTGVKTGHVGKITVTEEVANKLRPFQWEPWLPDVSKATLSEGRPVATVVIPVFNQDPKYLRAAILSAAHQSVPVEVIVVDDGSTTPVSSERLPRNVRVIRLPENRGVAAALNRGVTEMKTDWFFWLSSDDMMMPQKVEFQLAAMQQSRSKASYHRYQAIGDGSWARYTDILMWRSVPEQMGYLARVCAINGSTVGLHTSVFTEVGLFDTSLKYGQDWEMWCRVGEKFLFYPVDAILGTRREFEGNLTAEIEVDTKKRELRDAEDRLIMSRYAHWLRKPEPVANPTR